MRKLFWLLFVGFFFINPGAACTDEPDFQYGAAEMRAAVEGDWVLAITPPDGAPIAVTVHVAQAATAPGATARGPARSLVRAAYACGTRTLVKGAAACGDSSQMPLEVTFVSGDAALETATMSGSFLVDSLVFTSGVFYLALGPYRVTAQVDADGTVTSAHLDPGSDSLQGALSLTRS